MDSRPQPNVSTLLSIARTKLNVYIHVKKYNDAATAFEKVLNDCKPYINSSRNEFASSLAPQHKQNVFAIDLFIRQYASSIFLQLGNNYFNAQKYDRAANCYQEGINHIHSISQKDDPDYRYLISLYINLSDAMLELANQNEGEVAYSNAIRAFNLLTHKSSIELSLGDPTKDDRAFRHYYQELNSTTSYMSSVKFKNNSSLLTDIWQERSITNPLSEFNFSTDMDIELATNLSQVSFSSPFPVTHINTPDFEIRETVTRLIKLGKKYKSSGDNQGYLDTCVQALTAAKSIQNKNDGDQKNISFLTAETKQNKPAYPLTNILRFYQPVSPPQNHHFDDDTNKDDDSMDCTM